MTSCVVRGIVVFSFFLPGCLSRFVGPFGTDGAGTGSEEELLLDSSDVGTNETVVLSPGIDICDEIFTDSSC